MVRIACLWNQSASVDQLEKERTGCAVNAGIGVLASSHASRIVLSWLRLRSGMSIHIPSWIVQDEDASIAQCSERLRRREVSPVELLTGCLRRIEEWNTALNAFITVLTEQALDHARLAEAELTAGKWRGPLHGIPVAVKDFFDTAGIRTTAAFEPFKNRVPAKDAAVVVRLKEAGAIIVGKTNMHSLGMGTTGLESYFGPVLNPWSADHITGGSSSGSAAAVATGMCYASVDTDAIGSCRLPAACCGVVGFKGTYGLINAQGILEGEEDPGEMIRWFNHPGIMTRTAHDASLVASVLTESGGARPAHLSVAEARGGAIRVGVANNFRSDQEIAAVFDNAVETLRGLGYSSTLVAAPLQVPTNDLSNIVSDRRDVTAKVFGEIDVLLLPTTATTVPKINDARNSAQALSAENTIFANYYGLPAISIPCGFDASGLPMGLQIVGKPGNETSVLFLAQELQRAG
jgi:aspartyl-tRNA(Asn)/glutamyl-tRNA(Gln) amidotransferase subunit A